MPTFNEHFEEEYARPAAEAAKNTLPPGSMVMDAEQFRAYKRKMAKAFVYGHILDIVTTALKWGAVAAVVTPIYRSFS